MKTLCPQRIMPVSERQEASFDFHDLDHRTCRHLCRPSRSVRLGMDSVVRRHDPSNPDISTVISGILSCQRLRVVGIGYDKLWAQVHSFPYYDPTLMKVLVWEACLPCSLSALPSPESGAKMRFVGMPWRAVLECWPFG